MSKNIFKATEEQLNQLYDALKGGTPLLLALQYSKISRATYYYWVAISCVVQEVKTQEELEEMEEMAQSGVSISQIRDISDAAASQKRTGVGTYIEPSPESILQYKNSRKFRKFANKCHEVVTTCDAIRSEVAIKHLKVIQASTMKKNGVNASGSMWFLERNFSDFFSKPNEKPTESNEKVVVEPVKVEFVDPNTDECKARVAEMENDLLEKINGKEQA